MQSRDSLFCIIGIILLCNSAVESSEISARSRCSSGIKTIPKGRRQAQVVTPVPTLKRKYGYGLVDDRFPMAVKITEDFEYLQISLDFGSWPYEAPRVTAEQLGLVNDNLWHQLWIELKPTDQSGIDKWHIYIKSDQKDEPHDINTGYEWHFGPYHPKSFRVFVKGKSYWIPRGNASVCNTVDAEKRAAGYGGYGHLKGGSYSSLMKENNLLAVILPLLLLMRMAAAQAVD